MRVSVDHAHGASLSERYCVRSDLGGCGSAECEYSDSNGNSELNEYARLLSRIENSGCIEEETGVVEDLKVI